MSQALLAEMFKQGALLDTAVTGVVLVVVVVVLAEILVVVFLAVAVAVADNYLVQGAGAVQDLQFLE